MHRRPTTRPTVCRESAEITRDQWGAKRIFMPVLPLRWDEAGARADVAQRQFRVFYGGHSNFSDLVSRWLFNFVIS